MKSQWVLTLTAPYDVITDAECTMLAQNVAIRTTRVSKGYHKMTGCNAARYTNTLDKWSCNEWSVNG